MNRAERRRLQREEKKIQGSTKVTVIEAPYSNPKQQQLEKLAQELKTPIEKLGQLKKAAWDEGFEEGQNWSNAINTLAIAFALNDLYGFGWMRFQRTIRKANEYMTACNDRRMTVMGLAQEATEKWGMHFDKETEDLIKSIGL
ncbi:MAG: hypothetical protein LUG62_01175 [Clostridiales bacterium]|nr:hypothetical protein [Clostridiales bacterium]